MGDPFGQPLRTQIHLLPRITVPLGHCGWNWLRGINASPPVFPMGPVSISSLLFGRTSPFPLNIEKVEFSNSFFTYTARKVRARQN